jgi:hypothetical protein
MTTDITADSIDRYLGPASERYFGEGFKRVTHQITDLVIGRVDGRGSIRGTATLGYPKDWSRKSTGSLRPHVSSIDGLLLAVELAEACLTQRYGLDREQRRRMWLRCMEMRIAAPQENLTAFGVQAAQTSCAPAAPGSRCEHVSTFDCLIGTMRVTCAIEHDIASQIAATGHYRSSVEILGDPSDRYYGVGYKTRTQRVADIVPAPDGQLVRARITVTDPHTRRDGGFAGSYQPSASMLDCFLSLAQLAQVVAYRSDGIDRAQSNTLWMRRLTLSSSTPVHPLDAHTDATVTVARSRRLKVAGECWRAFDLSANFGAIQAQGSIAHALPHGLITEPAAA